MKKRWIYFVAVAAVIFVAAALILTAVLIIGNAKSNTKPQQTATAIPHNERQVVTTYNQAMVRQDWATVYASSATSVRGNYTPEEFSQIMTQQEQENGVIVAVTPISDISNPTIKTNTDGTTYFTVAEKVTIVKNGVSQTLSIVSLFILENSAWKYFTSKKV